ncbi:hypothetical protein Sru01_21420 [Sphaerisporangium rufum]|uniref:p-aminobenzoate N-oxygenase AurF n=1 Tax=Sphaerisporangium rufum TaxID=1381558 RepID=A0A919V4D9_9ACTN|nr:diiron oxygenase [Sphaerisporangium rufum]GII77160.1 hypothetical protein Sru01_21420 [Sphaerisporangium rufum]
MRPPHSAGAAEPPDTSEVAKGPGDAYRSAFRHWESRAGVRTRPRRVLDERGRDALFFPPEFVPATAHPLVAARGPGTAHRLLVHSLYQYLHFTTVLEQLAVLPVTAALSLGRAGVELPDGMRADAFKITTDEAWHAQFSYEFTGEVARVTGIAPSAVVEPRLVRALEETRLAFEPALHGLVDLVFAVVSETLVSALLHDVPRDGRLPGPVRALVADHAADEGRHHAYFREFLRRLWPALGPAARTVGPRVPELVRVFLDPDMSAVAAGLRASGFTPPQITEIIADCYGPAAPCRDVRPAARATVRAFAEVGALDDTCTRDAFADAGLLVEGPAAAGARTDLKTATCPDRPREE